ncbi:MAG: signal peptide peptidase SppA [Candidatus Krumholzibacteriota bacterium]
MKKFWIVFIIVAIFIGGGFGLLWFSLSNLEEAVSIDGGVLVWEMGGKYPEERDDSFWGQVRSAGELTMPEVLFSLYRAAEDERITGLVLDLRGAAVDWAKVEEIRGAVENFRDTGKPVVAYLDAGGTRDYALAAVADQVVVSPEANLMVLGISAELAFMRDTLDKLGMKADFVHVGAYKSAPERMTRSSASDANREMITSIVDDRYEALLDMLASSRGVDKDVVSGWIDQGMFDARGALKAGLVDTVMYFDELMDDRFGDEDITYLSTYSLDRPKRRSTEYEVAVVFITGVIMPGTSRFDNFQGKLAGSETVVEQLQSVGEDDDVDAVILRVDSPGGSALASDLIWNEIQKVQQNKPVIVSMSGLAASGGYYVACLGDSIFADPGTLTGSIGVYAGKMDRSGMYRKIGVNREFITRGKNALLFSDEGGFSDEQRELFQNQMDGFYERFLEKVAAGRGLTRDAVHEVAQGRVWTGRQGLERGLVDGMGGLHRSLDSAKWMLGADPADKVTIVTFGEELSLFERMLLKSLREGGGLAHILGAVSGMAGTGAITKQMPVPLLAEALREDGTLAAVELMDGRPVAMMPFWINMR